MILCLRLEQSQELAAIKVALLVEDHIIVRIARKGKHRRLFAFLATSQAILQDIVTPRETHNGVLPAPAVTPEASTAQSSHE